MKNEIEIDMVFLYVDGNEQEFQKKKNKYLAKAGKKTKELNPNHRHENVDEIIYSIRSVIKYIPWIRNIFIVTDNQIPPIDKYLLESGRVTIIDHKQIIPGKYLPTFNSDVIESFIQNIPGLSEIFLYNNDDVMHFNYVNQNDIYEIENNQLKLKIRSNFLFYYAFDDLFNFSNPNNQIYEKIRAKMRKYLFYFTKNFINEYACRLLMTSLLFIQKNPNIELIQNHHTKILRKSTCKLIENKYPNLLHEMRLNQFRGNNYIQYLFFVMNIDNILNKDIIIHNYDDVLELPFENKKYKNNAFDKILEKRPKFLCLNNMDLSYKKPFIEFMENNL